MRADVESARRDWEDGHRRLQERAAGDRVAAERLHAQVEAITAELRKRVGAMYTVAELVRAYGTAEPWARAAVAEHAAAPGWPLTLADALDAAFHLYARGAADYRP